MANIGFAVNNRRKNQQTGDWEEHPVWLDLKAFSNAGGGRKLADLAEKFLKKGQQIYVEGHLVLNEWTGKEDGQKRSRLVIHVNDIQFLDKKGEGGGGSAPPPRQKQESVGDVDLEEVPF